MRYRSPEQLLGARRQPAFCFWRPPKRDVFFLKWIIWKRRWKEVLSFRICNFGWNCFNLTVGVFCSKSSALWRFYFTAVDIWAWGCVVAEMHLGKPVLKGSSTIDMMHNIAGQPEVDDQTIVLWAFLENSRDQVRICVWFGRLLMLCIFP